MWSQNFDTQSVLTCTAGYFNYPHRPYVIDLNILLKAVCDRSEYSTNGTYVNNVKIELTRYYEPKERYDVSCVRLISRIYNKFNCLQKCEAGFINSV